MVAGRQLCCFFLFGCCQMERGEKHQAQMVSLTEQEWICTEGVIVTPRCFVGRRLRKAKGEKGKKAISSPDWPLGAASG